MIRVATYNAHDCIGRDGVYAPARIASIVAAIGADIVALQEITLDHAGDVLATLQNLTGMQAIDGTLFDRGVGRYGNLLLTQHNLIEQQVYDLSFVGREQRGMLEAVIDIEGEHWRLAATHLGLRPAERGYQIQRLATLLADDGLPSLLMGDFNVWRGSGALAPLIDIGFVQQPLRSFPTWRMPLFPLDRILLRGTSRVPRYWRYDVAPAALASDHFPIVLDLDGASE